MATGKHNIWSKQHIEELERMFPEQIGEMNKDQLLMNSGIRYVVYHIRNTYEQAVKTNAVS